MRGGQSSPGTRRRISSSGLVNGGLAGGIHPSFTTQKRKMVDLPHPGVPLCPPTLHRPLSISLSLPVPASVCRCGVVLCLASQLVVCSLSPFSMSALPDSCLLHSVSLNVFNPSVSLVCSKKKKLHFEFQNIWNYLFAEWSATS